MGDNMYIILEGMIELRIKINNNEDKTFKFLEKFDYFGELALQNYDSKRTASAIAHSDCKLAVINKKEYDTIIKSY